MNYETPPPQFMLQDITNDFRLNTHDLLEPLWLEKDGSSLFHATKWFPSAHDFRDMILDAETGQWEGEGVGASCVGCC